jgi:hypothetical protein
MSPQRNSTPEAGSGKTPRDLSIPPDNHEHDTPPTLQTFRYCKNLGGKREAHRFFLGALKFSSMFAVVWLLLFTVNRAFPQLQPGSDVIYAAKRDAVEKGGIFDPAKTFRVLVVGDSRSLSGFQPARFDAQIGEHCQSYNLGLPASNRYVEPLAAMIANGDAPTHILIQAPWPAATAPPTLLEWLRRDDEVMQALFPFRALPRNLAIFVATAHFRGGMGAYYRKKQEITEQMLADRGYHFIEGQSFYQDDRLPEDFSLPGDTPGIQAKRSFAFTALDFHKLAKMAAAHSIQCIIIPEFHRINACAEPPPENQELGAMVNPFVNFSVVGPDYYRYPNRFFSDHVHLNREGAAVYTDELAKLLRGRLSPPRSRQVAAAAGRRFSTGKDAD